MVDIIAHRGMSKKAPENTKASFDEVINNDIGGIELDVHLTSDKKAVVIHDEKIDRTSNNTGFVKDYTLKNLKKFDFGSYFNSNYKEEQILSLPEALDLLKNINIINIEIKKGFGFNEGIEKIVVNDIKNAGLSDKVIISSYNHDSLLKIKDLNPNLNTAALLVAKLNKPHKYAKDINCEYLHLYYKLLDLQLIKQCHKNDIKINAYTVNQDFAIKLLLKAKIDGIITDYPLRVKRLL